MEQSKLKKILIILTFVGLFVSTYLTSYKLSLNAKQENTFACDFGSCELVQSSKYAELFGIPVAVFGIAFYLALLMLLMQKRQSLSKIWILGGLAFSTYLTYIELFVLRAICGWCMVSFGIIILITMLYFGNERITARDSTSR